MSKKNWKVCLQSIPAKTKDMAFNIPSPSGASSVIKRSYQEFVFRFIVVRMPEIQKKHSQISRVLLEYFQHSAASHDH